MHEMRKTRAFYLGIAVAAVSFILLYGGVAFVAKRTVELQNIPVYLITAAIFGALAGGLTLFRSKWGSIWYLVGLGCGFIEMYRQFLSRDTGWNDLAGIMSLFVFAGIGLIAGLAVNLIQSLLKRR